jgi:DNA-binding LacI/PurR family transcriptional regulator
MPQATLLEIARRLKLSKSSVSEALSGKPGVSEAVEAEMRREAERLNYHPNPVAAELMALVRSRRRRTSE